MDALALTHHDYVCIAAIAGCAPRTAQRIYAGRPADATTLARVVHAALQLGLPLPPNAPNASPAPKRDITQLVIAARAVASAPLPPAPRTRRTTSRRRRVSRRLRAEVQP